jgi:uncharacterized membrane protein
VGLSPEERQRIYEEEKAKHEAGRSTGLKSNVAGLLCYLGVWVTGIIFLIIERKDRLVRFHAMQSLITFGTIGIITAVADGVRHWVPTWVGTPWDWLVYPQTVAANVVFGVFTAIGVVLWIVLMYQTYHGRLIKLAIFGDLAEKAVSSLDGTRFEDLEERVQAAKAEAEASPPPPPPPAATSESQPPPSAAAAEAVRAKRPARRFLEGSRAARITASVAVIGWSTFFLVFFNFFSRYFAIYSRETIGGISQWRIYPMFTPELSLVLPILNIALIASIAGHAVAIAIDHYRVRAPILIVLAALGMAAVVTFLRVFPFDFSVIPNPNVAAAMPTVAVVIMILITVGLGVSALVRFVRLMIHVSRGLASPPA